MTSVLLNYQKIWFLYMKIIIFLPINIYTMTVLQKNRCVKSARIRSYSGPDFPAFGLNTERYVVYFDFDILGIMVYTHLTVFILIES